MANLWCEVDLNIIAKNIDKIKKSTNKKIIAVVKRNAYGLGIERISEFLDDKVDGFAVNDVEEALKVRSEKPILILLPAISDSDIPKIKENFILTIDNEKILDRLKGRQYKVHIFVDTGMNRFGVKPEDVDLLIKVIKDGYPNIQINGIYTHLSSPEDKAYSLKQISVFNDTVSRYGSIIPNIHLLSSRGYLQYEKADLGNCLRIGSLIYGYGGAPYGFKQAFSYKARPIYISEIDKNEYIGYGNTYKTRDRVRAGIFDIGLADGFNCSRNVRQGFIYSLMRTVYHYFKKDFLIYWKDRPLEILGSSCMCFTTVNLNGLDVGSDMVFDIKLSSVLADSSIEKEYRI